MVTHNDNIRAMLRESGYDPDARLGELEGLAQEVAVAYRRYIDSAMAGNVNGPLLVLLTKVAKLSGSVP